MNGADLMSAGLRDIRGLDAVSIWPLATGWWMVLIALVLAILALVVLRRVGRPGFLRKGDWRGDARRLLNDLKQRLPALDGRTAACEFSELMRRIAMARTARDECAGLSGPAWLDWLSANDPAGFDWHEHGRIIIEIPYAPPGTQTDMDDMRRLITAASGWLAREAPQEAVSESSEQREAA